MVQLTEAIIKSKTKLDKLGDVRNLNLWGQDITDVSILQRTPHVEILSLSVNGITTLREFMHCKELKELYLRKNSVASLGDIRYLMPLVQLKVLWLSDNPCAEVPSYRQLLIAHLPQLEKLDNIEVTPAEKDAAKGMALLQPATSAELVAADKGWDACVADAPDPFITFSQQQQQQQQQLATAAVIPAPAATAAPSALMGANARLVGQAAIASGAGTSCGTVVSVTAPNAAAGAAASTYSASQCQHEPQYNPQRYSSQPGAQIPLVPLHAPTTDEQGMQQDKMSTAPFSSKQQYSVTPGRPPGSRTPPEVGSSNVLYAVMALMADLDASQLAIVQKEVEERLSGQHRAV